MDNNRPRGREKNVTGTGSVNKKGSGLGLGGAVGGGKPGSGLSGRPGLGSSGQSSGGGMPKRAAGGCGGGLIVVIAIIWMLLRGCGSLFGGGITEVPQAGSSSAGSTAGTGSTGGSSGAGTSSALEQLFGSGGYGSGVSGGSAGSSNLESLLESLYSGTGSAGSNSTSASSDYTQSSAYTEAFGNNQTIASGNTSNSNGVLNTAVDSAARAKFTSLKGGGNDQATVLVYMCGTDLESKYGMGTSDIKEMASAKLSDQVHVLVYTGGCRKWQNNFASNTYNQIYEVKSGGLDRLEDNFGQKPMTDPDTLTEFIRYGVQKYPADRYELIFWDHGSGTTGGYGYDEKYSTSGSMSLDGINRAVGNSNVKFDFIGFDACLMATLENALMLSDDADYLIASEETEPGTGWYYTNWLTALSNNTSIPTIEMGRMIADDFLLASQKVRQGDQVTLSITDLSELGQTVPARLSTFSEATTDLISNKEYKQVSDARRSAKEFAASNRIDQVDIVDFALGVGTDEALSLAQTIKAAVKYNRTSKSYGDAHGLSVYFPLKRASYIDKVVRMYQNIGMDSEYTRCISAFANVAVSGQAAGGGTTSPYSSLFGGSSTSDYSSDLISSLFGSSYSSSSSGGSSYSGGSADSSSYGASSYSNLFGSGSGSSGQDELMNALLGSLLGGSYGGITGLDRSNTAFLEEEAVRSAAEYVFENHINTDDLFWTRNASGETVLNLSEEDWKLVQDLELSVLYDDGEGFIDLGLDTVYNYDDDGALLGEYDQTWLAINGQPVAYYHLDTVDDGVHYAIHGYVPAFVNGDLCDILLTFDDERPYGYVSGIRLRYEDDTVETVAKDAVLMEDDEVQFICDYYTYEGTFVDNFELGDAMVIHGEPEISNVIIGDAANAAYCLTDIYNEAYWTPVIP